MSQRGSPQSPVHDTAAGGAGRRGPCIAPGQPVAAAASAADVLTIENSRSGDEMIRALSAFGYSRDLGPGVYDVHRCALLWAFTTLDTPPTCVARGIVNDGLCTLNTVLEPVETTELGKMLTLMTVASSSLAWLAAPCRSRAARRRRRAARPQSKSVADAACVFWSFPARA